jgi:multiple sugar transport system substrate-binding protein
MLKLKRVFTLIVAVVFVLSACSSKGTSNEGAGKGGSTPGDKVTITYGLWDQVQVPAMEAIISKFKETHPNIDVKIELTPWAQYWTKLDTAATGGTLPDIFWINAANLVKYASNNILMPLNDNVTADKFDMMQYYEFMVKMYTYNGKYYGMPKDYDAVGLWYNKKLFDDAKIPYPDDSWDWNKLVETAKKLTDPSKGVWGIPAQLAGQTGYYNTLLMTGGYIISPDGKSSGFDTPEGIRAIHLLTDLIHVHKVSPTLAQMTDTTPIDMFKSGKVAMIMHGSWNVKDFATNDYTKDKVDVAVLPKDKVRAGIAHGLANVIFAKTKHPKEVWEFAKFIGSKEAAQIQAKDGTAHPAMKDTEQAWINSAPKFNLKAFIDMAAVSSRYAPTLNSGKFNQIEIDNLKKAFTGEVTPEEAGKQTAAKINEVLK